MLDMIRNIKDIDEMIDLYLSKRDNNSIENILERESFLRYRLIDELENEIILIDKLLESLRKDNNNVEK